MESARHSFGHTRLQSPAFTKFADLSNVSADGGVDIIKLACLVGKADVVGIINFLHVVAGRSLMYKLKRVGASTDPCGRPFFCILHELLMSRHPCGHEIAVVPRAVQ